MRHFDCANFLSVELLEISHKLFARFLFVCDLTRVCLLQLRFILAMSVICGFKCSSLFFVKSSYFFSMFCLNFLKFLPVCFITNLHCIISVTNMVFMVSQSGINLIFVLFLKLFNSLLIFLL